MRPDSPQQISDDAAIIRRIYDPGAVDPDRLTRRFFAAVHAGDPVDAGKRAPVSRARMSKRQSHTSVLRRLFWMGGAVAGIATFAVWRVPANESVASPTVYQTRAGEQAQLTLADGSQIMLRPDTRIELDPVAGSAERVIALQGEAFFTVAHDGSVPLSVHTGNAIVRVLGTAFSVRQYTDDVATRVAVEQGRVAVNVPGRAGSTFVVTPGILVSADSGGVSTINNIALDDALAWTKHRLVFRKTPLREAISELERQYGVTLKLPPALVGSDSLTAHFGNAPVREVLDAVAMAFELRYTIRDRVVTFEPVRPAAKRNGVQDTSFTGVRYGK